MSPPAPTPRNEATPAGGRCEPRSTCWRVVLDRRALPLPVLRPAGIGSDPRNAIQLTHGSVRPFHARIQKSGDVLHLERLDEAGSVAVDGVQVARAVLRGGEEVRIGELRLRIERGEIAAAVTALPRAPLSLEQEFAHAFLRELRRMPWLAISVGLHLVLLAWLDSVVWRRIDPEENLVVRAEVDEDRAAMPLADPDDVWIRPPEPTETAVELPEPDAPLEEPDDEPPATEQAPVNGIGYGDLGAFGTGSGTVSAGGFGGRGVHLGGVEGALRGRIEAYRDHGLDVVFLIDTTASMESFLRAAKQTVDGLITDLADLVPNLRLGMVAYRDEGDAYLTRSTPISADRYAILNFLEGLQAQGGGDIPEAILAAVEYAFDDMEWRPQAHRVLLIVADAPPHPGDEARLRMRLRSAARGTAATTVVSTIFTGRGQLSVPRQVEAESALRDIAQAGGGEFTYLEESGQVTSQIMALTLGRQHLHTVARLLESRTASPRHVLVEQKVKQREVDWLLRKLAIVPIEPRVVSGLVEIGSPAVALRCLDLVSDADHPRPVREAALYVLRRITPYRGALDLSRSLATQGEDMKDLQEALERTYRERAVRAPGR